MEKKIVFLKQETSADPIKSLQDLSLKAEEYFKSLSGSLFSIPEFPTPSPEEVLDPFTFRNFVDHVKKYHKHKSGSIPRILQVVAKLYAQKAKSWLDLDLRNMFTWSDIYVSKIIYDNTVNHCKAIANFMLGLCECVYKDTFLFSEDKTFKLFMSHPIYDYSRPHNWHLLQDYVSYSQFLMAVYREEAGKSYPSALDGKFISQSNSSIISRFLKSFPGFFQSTPTSQNIEIPYSLYKRCWTSAQSDTTIQPYDIEICFYYTQQKNLGPRYVVDDLWKEGDSKNNDSKSTIAVVPLMKFFSLYDWKRLWIMNAIITSEDDPNPNDSDSKNSYSLVRQWEKAASKVFFYEHSPTKKGLGYLAISRANIFLAHQDALNNFYYVGEGYSEIYYIVQSIMLNRHLSQSILFWKMQDKHKHYDVFYLNSITRALNTLISYGKFLMRAKKKIRQNEKAFPEITKKLIKQCPFIEVMAILLKLQHYPIPEMTEVLIENEKGNRTLNLLSHHFPANRKVALCKLKKLPSHTYYRMEILINKLQSTKTLQDYFVPCELIYSHNNVQMILESISQNQLQNQGLLTFQKEQNPQLALRGIRDLNALLIIHSISFNPHAEAAGRILRRLPDKGCEECHNPDLILCNTGTLGVVWNLIKSFTATNTATKKPEGEETNTKETVAPNPMVNQQVSVNKNGASETVRNPEEEEESKVGLNGSAREMPKTEKISSGRERVCMHLLDAVEEGGMNYCTPFGAQSIVQGERTSQTEFQSSVVY